MNEKHSNQRDDHYKLENPLEFFWADKTRLISESKARRWDILKWAVTVNIALTAFYASMNLQNSSGATASKGVGLQLDLLILIVVILLTLIAELFLYIQNCEIEKRRDNLNRMIQERLDVHSRGIFEYLYGKLPGKSEELPKETDKLGSRRDWMERYLYYLVIGVSAFPLLGLTLVDPFCALIRWAWCA